MWPFSKFFTKKTSSNEFDNIRNTALSEEERKRNQIAAENEALAKAERERIKAREAEIITLTTRVMADPDLHARLKETIKNLIQNEPRTKVFGITSWLEDHLLRGKCYSPDVDNNDRNNYLRSMSHPVEPNWERAVAHATTIDVLSKHFRATKLTFTSCICQYKVVYESTSGYGTPTSGTDTHLRPGIAVET